MHGLVNKHCPVHNLSVSDNKGTVGRGQKAGVVRENQCKSFFYYYH